MSETEQTVQGGKTAVNSAGDVSDNVSVNGAATAGQKLHELAQMRRDPNAIRELFLSGDYPYKSKIPRAEYEEKKSALQVECVSLARRL
jgi:hypothetical protein